jgi:hypothetical protein
VDRGISSYGAFAFLFTQNPGARPASLCEERISWDSALFYPVLASD